MQRKDEMQTNSCNISRTTNSANLLWCGGLEDQSSRSLVGMHCLLVMPCYQRTKFSEFQEHSFVGVNSSEVNFNIVFSQLSESVGTREETND